MVSDRAEGDCDRTIENIHQSYLYCYFIFMDQTREEVSLHRKIKEEFQSFILSMNEEYSKYLENKTHQNYFSYIYILQSRNFYNKLMSILRDHPDLEKKTRDFLFNINLDASNGILFEKYCVICGEFIQSKKSKLDGLKMLHLSNGSDRKNNICYHCKFNLSFDQEFNLSKQTTRKCIYDPSKHCMKWISKIQANNIMDIDASVIRDIKEYFSMEYSSDITIDNIYREIRKYLKQNNLTEYNRSISSIGKLVFDINPPKLSKKQNNTIIRYFKKCLSIFESLKEDKKKNCIYYPYLIYKIIEQLIIIDSSFKEKRDILKFIHLQNQKTLIKNDDIWEKICEKIREFEYKPTIIS